MLGPFRLPAGSATVPSFGFTPEPATGLYFPGTGILGFTVAAAERMRLNSTGSLIIGSTADTTEKLQVTGTAKITGATAIGGALTVAGLTTITNITSAGAPQVFNTTGAYTPAFQAIGSSINDATYGTARFANSAAGSYMFLGHSRGSAAGTQTVLTSGDTSGGVIFQSSNGTGFYESGRMQGVADGTQSSTSVPGALEFYTTPSGSLTSSLALSIRANNTAEFSGPVTGASTLRLNGAVYGTLGTRQGGAYGGAGPNGAADDLVIEGNGSQGITILTPNTSIGYILFGDPEGATVGGMHYTHSTNTLNFRANANTTVVQITDANMTVNGTLTVTDVSTFSDTITAPRLRLTSGTDATATSTNHGLQVGLTTGANVIIDENEVMGRTNGVVSPLYINNDGGQVGIGAGGLCTTGQLIADYNAYFVPSFGSPGDIFAARSATAGAIYFGRASTTYLYFDGTDYNFGTGGPVVTAGRYAPGSGTAALPGYTFDSDRDTGMYRYTTNGIAFATAGAAGLSINASQEVNISGGSGSFKVGGDPTRFETSEITVPTSSTLGSAISHGGSRTPDLVQWFLRCKSAEGGWSAGTEIPFPTNDTSSTTRQFQSVATASTIRYHYIGSGAPIIRDSSSAQFVVTPASWKIVGKCHWL